MDPRLEQLQEEIRSAITGLSIEQLNWHPPGKWCVNEILEHLYLTYTGTSKGFSRVLESGNPPGKTPTWKQRAQSYIVVSLGYFPTGVQSPAVARPRGASPEKIQAEITSRIGEMDAIMSNCEAKFGSAKKILDHPMLGPFSIAQWRKFHLVHGLHHVKQIRRLGNERL